MSFAEAVARDRASFHEEMPRATRGLEPRRRRLEGKWGTVHGARPSEFDEQKIVHAYLREIAIITGEMAGLDGKSPAWH